MHALEAQRAASSAAQRHWQRAARDESAEREPGLVIAAYLAARPDGRLVQLRLPGIAPEGGTRGVIEGFSDASRRRLMVLMNGLRRNAMLPTMVTLTFPAEIKVTPAEAKQCLHAWQKRVRRVYRRWCSIWRLEAHPDMSSRLGRVHPHLHLLTWGAWYDLEWVSRTWTSVVWSVLKIDECLYDETAGVMVRAKHEKAGTNCERIRAWKGAMYAAKNYIGKGETYPLGEAGRVWGVYGRRLLPMAAEIIIGLTIGMASRAVAAAWEWMRERQMTGEHLVRTFFCADPISFAAGLGVVM